VLSLTSAQCLSRVRFFFTIRGGYSRFVASPTGRPKGGRQRRKGAFLEAYERLRRLVIEAQEDVLKGASGNKAAKVRARKKMQEIKAAAQEVREGLLTSDDKGDQAGDDKPE
jgi:hypothetical protein